MKIKLMIIAGLFASLNTATAFSSGIHSVEKTRDSDGRLIFVANGKACAPFPAIDSDVKKISDSAASVKLEIYTMPCREGESPRNLSFYMGDFKFRLKELGLDPKTTELYFHLGGIIDPTDDR